MDLAVRVDLKACVEDGILSFSGVQDKRHDVHLSGSQRSTHDGEMYHYLADENRLDELFPQAYATDPVLKASRGSRKPSRWSGRPTEST